MLRSMKELKNYTIGATDGEIGHVTDFYFDDASWVVRYLIVETGLWLMGKKVLISPYSLMQPDWMHKRLPVRISRSEVENSPNIDTAMPVSRQHEMTYADYYGHPYYWSGTGFWGDGLYFPVMTPTWKADSATGATKAVPPNHAALDPHLRSCNAIVGYHIHAQDGDIGHVQGMLVDEETWSLRYLVVETTHWWWGHQILVAPQWIEGIAWEDSTVSVNLTRQTIKSSPIFNSTTELNRQDEMELHQHYQRSAYWEQEPGKANAPT
jgi:uncharacterized protein YrrD